MKSFLNVLLFVGKRITIFTFAILILSSFVFFEEKEELSDLAKASCNLHDKVSLVLRKYKKLNFVCTGIYRDSNETIETLVYHFQIDQPLETNEARALIINVIEDTLKTVNKDSFSRPWLMAYPFSYESLDIAIFIHDRDGDFLNHPKLCLVETKKKNIRFITQESGFIPKYIETTEEPFEEAYLKVKGKKFDIKDYLGD